MNLPELAERIARLRAEKDSVNKILKALNEDLTKAERSMIEAMNSQEMDSFKCAHGAFGISRRFTVTTPKSPEDKEAFFEYLRKKGEFDSMISVNSRTLASWYKEEVEAAKSRGEMDFVVPGLKDAGISEYLSVRKV